LSVNLFLKDKGDNEAGLCFMLCAGKEISDDILIGFKRNFVTLK